MASDANNGGSNIKWLFVVVLQGACCFIFGCSLGTSLWVGCFSQVAAHRVSSYIQLVLLCWCFPGDTYYLGATVFQRIFQWLFLTFIYYYIYIFIHFCLFFAAGLGFLQLPHTYITILSGFVLLDLVDMLLLLNLPCVILLSLTLKIFFPQDFSLLFEINYRNCKKYFM